MTTFWDEMGQVLKILTIAIILYLSGRYVIQNNDTLFAQTTGIITEVRHGHEPHLFHDSPVYKCTYEYTVDNICYTAEFISTYELHQRDSVTVKYCISNPDNANVIE